MLTRQIPFGSGLIVAILGRRTSHVIQRVNRAGWPAILFVHPWQLYQAPAIRGLRFKLRVLARNPLCLPYTRCIVKQFLELLQRHGFTSFERFYFAHGS